MTNEVWGLSIFALCHRSISIFSGKGNKIQKAKALFISSPGLDTFYPPEKE